MSALIHRPYKSLIESIWQLLVESKSHAYQQVNSILVQTYWQIGKYIVEYEQGGKDKAEYGSWLLKSISYDLAQKFGKGFSQRNIEQMKKLYLLFQNPQTLSAKLSWSHYSLIIRLDDLLARKFYCIETEKYQRSVRELERQIDSMLFERIALSKDKQWVLDLATMWQMVEHASDIIKDPYMLEFLWLQENHSLSETDLEQKLITHLQKFLLELGDWFSFVSRQKRITMDGDHYYIDLVFYHRLLQCFVLIDLKIGRLKHQDIGQMQMYVNWYDRQIKAEYENKTIWLILCADKKESTIQYTLPEDNNQIFASKYKLYLPNKELLQAQLQQLLNE